MRAARWQPGRRFFRGASWSWSADDGVMHGRGGPPRLTRPSEERSMNIIRVIFVMALELTVIYTRETDRVPMTASDLSRPSLLPVDRAQRAVAVTAACTAGLGARGKRKPKPTETKGGGLLILLPATLAPSFVTYLASPFAEIAPGGEGLCPPARLRLEFSISHWSVCDRLLMFCRGISPSNHASPSGSIPLGSERKTNETSPNEAEGQCSGRESPVSKVNYFRRPNEPPGKGRRGVKPVDGGTGGWTSRHTCLGPASSLDAE